MVKATNVKTSGPESTVRLKFRYESWLSPDDMMLARAFCWGINGASFGLIGADRGGATDFFCSLTSTGVTGGESRLVATEVACGEMGPGCVSGGRVGSLGGSNRENGLCLSIPGELSGAPRACVAARVSEVGDNQVADRFKPSSESPERSSMGPNDGRGEGVGKDCGFPREKSEGFRSGSSDLAVAVFTDCS